MNINDYLLDDDVTAAELNRDTASLYDINAALNGVDIAVLPGQERADSLPNVVGGALKDEAAPQEIDPELTTGAMMTLIHAEVARKGLAGHHLDSMNSFYKVGIKQIVTKVYTIEGRLRNQRDKTDEDKDIAEIHYRVDFTDINLTPPTTVKYKSGATQMLLPNMARLKNLTYSSQMYIDAKITATAIYKNGTKKVRTGEFKNHRFASMPCAVRTELCNTYGCSKETLKAMEEDPQSPGGYFIIRGSEWTIDNLENITNNTFHVYRNMYKNEIARGTFLSKPGDAFENSYQVVMRYLVNGAITIEITTGKKDKFEIPFYLIFRALGMIRDREIINHIVYGVENTDPITKSLLEILQRAFDVEDAKFGPIRKSINSDEIIAFIATRITDVATASAKKDDNVLKYLNTSILSIIDRYIFPHIGTGIEHRIRKLRFFGHLINRLLCVYLGVIAPTDRDSYKNKRVFAAGTSLAKAFKTNFNFAVAKEVRRKLIKDFKSSPFSQVALVKSVMDAINSDDLERLLTQSITTGNKTITIKRNEYPNRLSSGTLYHKNDMNVKSTLGTINTPNSGQVSKQNERADEMRRVHPTYLGFIDISQTAESGEKVGMSKQMTLMCSITGASSSYVLKRILAEDTDVIRLDDVRPEQITHERLAKVFVNGDWVGCCREYHLLARKYRNARRRGEIHRLTSVVWEPMIREVRFWTDVGRLMRPLVIVYNNIEAYVDNWRHGDKSMQFSQWILLRQEHIRGLQSGKITMEDLQRDQIIEYISPEEQDNTYLAPNLDLLRERQHDLQHMYTHCDIEQAIFGIITMSSPLGAHSASVRNALYTCQRKQSAGWFALNSMFRIDKNVTFQHYCERPLVSTFSDALTYPNGQNTIVALALHGGMNCEDSITVNQNSVDCGMYNAAYYNYEKTELDKGEQFDNPDYARTMDIKKDAVYEYIRDGVIAEGTIARRGYVLIVKAAKIPKPENQYLWADRSIVYKKEEPVYIDRVLTTRNDEDVLFTKVKLRANRPLAVGDKLSSRTGNKGIVSNKISRCDMLYCEDGLVPDILINAHSIPTRMAINQVIECVYGQLAARRGASIDATILRNNDISAVVAELDKRGIKYGGHRRTYNGRTGEWIDTHIFIGPTCYQRLQKFVIDEQYAMRTGPTSAMTRQPLAGKNNDGGLRMGEMEAWCGAAAGTMRALSSKFYNDSDGITVYVCRNCGARAVVNEKLGMYKCKYCVDAADIAAVQSSWMSNLLLNELSAMNIKTRLTLEPYTYPRAE